MNQRELAYKILKDVMINGKYANLLMRQELNKIEPIHRGFVTEVVYGVLRNNIYLRDRWSNLISRKCDEKLAIIIDMSIYQLEFMDKEAYAVIDEANKLAGKYHKKFVNAILRQYLNLPKRVFDLSKIEELSVLYSIPCWILNLWKAHYGFDKMKEILFGMNTNTKMFYRINSIKASHTDLKHLDIEMLDDFAFISKNNLINTVEFKEGLFVAQDLGSQKIPYLLDVKDNMKVLDVCSAPGTKTSFIAALMNNTGTILATDLHEHRVQLVDDLCKRLNVKNVKTMVNDATVYNERLGKDYDRILMDVPCSGLGVLKRKPDIKFNISPAALDEIIDTQRRILENIAPLLKVGGKFVYSTCTLNKKENEKQIQIFLNSHSNFKLIKEETIFPSDLDSDGFYMAQCQRME